MKGVSLYACPVYLALTSLYLVLDPAVLDISTLDPPLRNSRNSRCMASLAKVATLAEDKVFDIINCVGLYYEKGASGNAFL